MDRGLLVVVFSISLIEFFFPFPFPFPFFFFSLLKGVVRRAGGRFFYSRFSFFFGLWARG